MLNENDNAIHKSQISSTRIRKVVVSGRNAFAPLKYVIIINGCVGCRSKPMYEIEKGTRRGEFQFSANDRLRRFPPAVFLRIGANFFPPRCVYH